MNANQNHNISQLDHIRRSGGTEALKSFVLKTGVTEKARAAALLNDRRTSFACLYLLMPEIEALELRESLNLRNKTAAAVCANVAKGNFITVSLDLSPEDDQKVFQILRWMFHTGTEIDGISDEFDKIMDLTASLLTRKYGDKALLPDVAALVFKRHRNGRLIHDLVWAMFGIHDPEMLNVIAGYLRSSNPADVELASTLLHLDSNEGEAGRSRSKYAKYLSWLKENSPYLSFTEDSFQSTSAPTPCFVDLESKYLCKTAPRDRKQKKNFTESEQSLIRQFKEAGDEEKKLLSQYSNRIHSRNPRYWDKWIHSPVSEQINIAKSGRGGTR